MNICVRMKPFLFLLVVLAVFPLSAQDKRQRTAFLEKVEQRIFDSINTQRQLHSLPPFIRSPQLQHLAKVHSSNMVIHDFFSHKDHRGFGPDKRKEMEFPYLIGGIGENIATSYNPKYGQDAEEIAEDFVDEWMSSSGHRANILSTRYSYTGIGIAEKEQTYYATQTFGDLIAHIINKPPRPIRYGTEHRFLFQFLGDFPRENITIFIRFPDENAHFYLPDGSYYTGMGVYEPTWEGNRFSLSITFDKGRGEYELLMGKDGSFYPQGISFLVD